MFTLQNINVFVNFLLFFELLFLNIYLFGRKESMINHIPKWSYWILRISVSVMTVGALFAGLAHPDIIWQQFTRNLGTTIMVGWALIFHYVYIVKKETPTEKKSPVKRTPTKSTKKTPVKSATIRKPRQPK